MTTQTIGRYQLDRTVGEGAYGTVYRAVDPTLDRAVAIKLLKPDVRDANGPETTLEEAKTLAKMNHPNIVTLFEVLEEAGQTALVMEFIDGEPLGDYLERVNPGLDDRLKMARQIADALAEAHGHGIVHADIKPGNVIITGGGKPVVVDFGLSKAVPQTTEMATLTGGSVGQNMILGTLAYMAPEVMKGGKPDERSDIFSFGALFYELLTGLRAFKAPSDAETVNLVLNVDPMPVSAYTEGVPAWCTNLAARMLAKDTEGRPKSFRDILRAIDTGDAGTPVRDIQAAATRKRVITGKRITIALLLMIATLSGFFGAQFYESETPTISSRINAGLENLRNFQKKGAIEEAKALFQNVLQEDPENAAATAGYSLALSLEFSDLEADPKKAEEAAAAAQLAISLDNQLALGHTAMAWTNEFQGQADAARLEYQRALDIDPTSYLAIFGFGRFLIQQGDFVSAEQHFLQSLELYPEDGWLNVMLGNVFFSKGRFDEAEHAILKGLEYAPDDVHAYRNLSAVLYAKNDVFGAIKAAQNGLQIRPDSMLYNNLGTFYFALGQYPQAAASFERAVDMQGNSHNYFHWANLGDAYVMLPDSREKAKVAYKRAIQLLSNRMHENESRPNMLSRAGLYHAKADEIEHARVFTQRALVLNPNNRWVLFRAAVVEELSGDREAAIEFLRRSVDAGQPVTDIKNEPFLASLREDPRYHELMAVKNLD